MNKLMNLLPHLIIIVHMFAVKLDFPVNLYDFIAGLFPLLTIDIFPTDYIYNMIFGFRKFQDAPLSD